jgi:uncharacterized NAD-dependent epimerase/dehydratase family protein
MRGLPEYPLPSIVDCLALNLACARLTSPAASFVGISLNTSALSEAEGARAKAQAAAQSGLPCVDPVRDGAAPLVDRLLEVFP